MGIYAEYLDRKMSFPALTGERKTQLARIAGIRQRDVLVYRGWRARRDPNTLCQPS